MKRDSTWRAYVWTAEGWDFAPLRLPMATIRSLASLKPPMAIGSMESGIFLFRFFEGWPIIYFNTEIWPDGPFLKEGDHAEAG